MNSYHRLLSLSIYFSNYIFLFYFKKTSAANVTVNVTLNNPINSQINISNMFGNNYFNSMTLNYPCTLQQTGLQLYATKIGNYSLNSVNLPYQLIALNSQQLEFLTTGLSLNTNNNCYTMFSSGSLIWNYQTSNPIDNSSPVIDANGYLYIADSVSYVYSLYRNGSLRWKFTASNGIYSSPTVANNGMIYISAIDNYIYALNNNGTLAWKYQLSGSTTASVATSNNAVYVGDYNGKLFAFNLLGSLLWIFATGDAIYNNAAIGSDGTIYVWCYDANLYAITTSGLLKWKYFTSSSGNIETSPAIGNDGTIYIVAGA